MEEQETQQQEKFIKMTQTPVPRLICGLAAPCILSMLITSFYNMADTYFVSRIGTSATAASTLSMPIQTSQELFYL